VFAIDIVLSSERYQLISLSEIRGPPQRSEDAISIVGAYWRIFTWMQSEEERCEKEITTFIYLHAVPDPIRIAIRTNHQNPSAPGQIALNLLY